jgi:nucleoid-associated protein YejK
MTKVIAAVIHRLVKDRHGPATVKCRDELLVVDEPVRALIGEIQKLYADMNRPGFRGGRLV